LTDLAPELVDGLLDRMPVARLALIDGADCPDVMPIVFARVGRLLFSPIDGKPKRTARLARLAHIERDKRFGLVLDHYAEDWRELWWLRLQGDAEIAAGAHPDWDAAVAALRTKYRQYRTTPLFRAEPVLIVLAWREVRWWAAGGSDAIAQWLAAQGGPATADPN
jgi:PPOX class probable F420-dependent enzyme